MISKALDSSLIAVSSFSIWSARLGYCFVWCLSYVVVCGISILLCFLWILRSVVRDCSSVPVRWREVEREEREGARRGKVLEVSSRRRVVLFLYRLLDDGPRPSEYGACCGLGCLVLAMSAHVVLLFFVGCGSVCCCSGDVAGGPWLAAADLSWLAWFGGGGSFADGSFVLFLRRIKLATGWRDDEKLSTTMAAGEGTRMGIASPPVGRFRLLLLFCA